MSAMFRYAENKRPWARIATVEEHEHKKHGLFPCLGPSLKTWFERVTTDENDPSMYVVKLADIILHAPLTMLRLRLLVDSWRNPK